MMEQWQVNDGTSTSPNSRSSFQVGRFLHWGARHLPVDELHWLANYDDGKSDRFSALAMHRQVLLARDGRGPTPAPLSLTGRLPG